MFSCIAVSGLAAMTKTETIIDLVGQAFIGALLGPVVVLIATILGCLVGALLEASSGITVYRWEMAPLIVLVIASPGSAAVSSLGMLTGRYNISLVAGLLINAIVFTSVLVPRWGSNPAAVSIWAITVGSIAGGAAGAIGGLIGKRRANNGMQVDARTSRH
jgi:hypothetical protein